MAETELSARRVKRLYVPLTTVVLAGIVIGALSLFPPESFDRGMQRILSVIVSIVASTVILTWFFGLAGISRRTRAIAASVLVLLAAGGISSVRRVEFSGDMEPTFDFRWQKSREAILADYLQTTGHAVSSASIDLRRELRAEDSPRYRGRASDGIVVGPELARDWSVTPPRCLWRHPCGGGYASFAVVGDRAVTIEQRGADEAIVCYDVSTGKENWIFSYPALFSERLGGDGPRATPTIQDDVVYSLGATGELVKLDFATGAKQWQLNILQENKAGNLEWGMSGSPLVYDDRIVVNPGAQQGTSESADVLILNAAAGAVEARGGKARASYSSPTLATLLGEPQLLIFDAVGLAGFAPADGRELWRVDWKSDFDINAAQPIVLDDRTILITSQAGCALVALAKDGDQWSTEERWRNRWMKCSYANPVAQNGFLYGLDEGILACLDLGSGKRLWKSGRYGHGQLLLTGDLLVILSEKGELALVEASPAAYHELGRIQAIDGKTWNNPVLVNGRALVRNHLEMACYELPLASNATSATQPSTEQPSTEQPSAEPQP